MLVNPDFLRRLENLWDWFCDHVFEIAIISVMVVFVVILPMIAFDAREESQKRAAITADSKTACIEKKLYKEVKEEYILVIPKQSC